MTENMQTLDARGLNCPLPILRTKKAIDGMAPGEILEITATDPGSVKGLDAFCGQTGNKILSSDEADGEVIFSHSKGMILGRPTSKYMFQDRKIY